MDNCEPNEVRFHLVKESEDILTARAMHLSLLSLRNPAPPIDKESVFCGHGNVHYGRSCHYVWAVLDDLLVLMNKLFVLAPDMLPHGKHLFRKLRFRKGQSAVVYH